MVSKVRIIIADVAAVMMIIASTYLVYDVIGLGWSIVYGLSLGSLYVSLSWAMSRIEKKKVNDKRFWAEEARRRLRLRR